MTQTAIRVSALGKEYKRGAKQTQDPTLVETIASSFVQPIKRLGRVLRGGNVSALAHEETFWALEDVSFELKHGEVLGVIGRNGAGKSTLLKILSRITYPTRGRIELFGRIGSLLEVGTGFHPELTGRENVYLNGSILGMKRHEIERKFDEIVAFSEVEAFIDTPVKHYSSGMIVRLAFAVAAHLEPEILVVDEVLAVGDAGFQQKSLGKMNDVASEGRTVIFVSHNMSAINNLCQRGIVLEAGKMVFDGATSEAVSTYLNTVSEATENPMNPVIYPTKENLPIQIRAVTLENSDGVPTNEISFQDEFMVRIQVQVYQPSLDYYSVAIITDMYGNMVIFASDEDLEESAIAKAHVGLHEYVVKFPSKLLTPSRYYLTVSASRHPHGKIDRHENLMVFEIVDFESRRAMKKLYRKTSIVSPEIPWILES